MGNEIMKFEPEHVLQFADANYWLVRIRPDGIAEFPSGKFTNIPPGTTLEELVLAGAEALNRDKWKQPLLMTAATAFGMGLGILVRWIV